MSNNKGRARPARLGPAPDQLGRRAGAVLNTLDFPADFFKGRGAVYGGATGLRVSDNNFADINPSYAAEFIPFSEAKLFAPIGTTQVEITFRIPGSDTVAAVRSFGAVVVDVDKANTSRLQAYDRAGKLIADVAGAGARGSRRVQPRRRDLRAADHRPASC